MPFLYNVHFQLSHLFMFRRLSRDLIKIGNSDILSACAIKKNSLVLQVVILRQSL